VFSYAAADGIFTHRVEVLRETYGQLVRMGVACLTDLLSSE
jgi:hypothetical protein